MGAMGYQDDDQVARRSGDLSPVDSALLARSDVRDFLASHDIGAFYRVLCDNGWSQHRIAKATKTQQSAVSEIIKGRRVIDYRVLVRIAEGLGIPRELMHLGSGDGDAYAGGVAVANTPEGVSAEMRRRALLAAAGMAVAGRPLHDIGELVGGVSEPAPVPLPSRIFEVHVAKVRDLTQRLVEAGRTFGSDPEVSSAAATWATRLLGVPGAEPVKQALKVAAAELHIEAGWAAFDGGLYDRAMQHYTRALELATEAGDAYCQTLALNLAGLATEEHGHPNDGLKMLQYGQAKAWDIPADDQRTVLEAGSRVVLQACGRADSATALARLGYWDAANAELATSRELWRPTRTDPAGDLDSVAARLEVIRGRLDVAESFAAASVRRWEGGSQRARTQADILLATIHIQTGEPGGVQLAHRAINGVTKLSSVRARRRLQPLVAALNARPRSDHRELARMAHQVATTRP
jgi:transcriptional regulator with XRE-family HTH domain